MQNSVLNLKLDSDFLLSFEQCGSAENHIHSSVRTVSPNPQLWYKGEEKKKKHTPASVLKLVCITGNVFPKHIFKWQSCFLKHRIKKIQFKNKMYIANTFKLFRRSPYFLKPLGRILIFFLEFNRTCFCSFSTCRIVSFQENTPAKIRS